MKKNSLIKNILLVLVGSIPVVFVFVFFFTGKGIGQLFTLISDEEIKETKAICSNLIPPASFMKIRERELLKSNSATYTTEYSSNENPKNVEEYFVNALALQGWEFKRENDVGSVELAFYRNKFSVTINYENLSLTSDRKYMISCSWRSSRHGLIGDLFYN